MCYAMVCYVMVCYATLCYAAVTVTFRNVLYRLLTLAHGLGLAGTTVVFMYQPVCVCCTHALQAMLTCCC